MSYFPKFKVAYDDTPNLDAYGRLRISQPITIFEIKQTTDDGNVHVSSKYMLGATGSWNINRASTLMSVSSSIGSTAIRQSKQRMYYQPGRSIFNICSAIFGPPIAGIRRRVGPFDDRNGVFLENNGSNVNVVLRSNVTGTPTDTAVTQSSWNLDTFDGNGPSGIRLDLTKIQAFLFDMQWLGAGRIRFGFDISGSLYYAHQFVHANLSSSVITSTPDLPSRFEITNVSSATTGTLEQICAAALSEGGSPPKYHYGGIDRGTTLFSGANTAALYPLITVRVKRSCSGAYVLPRGGSIFCTTNAQNGYRWALIRDAQYGSPDVSSWTSITSGSIEYNTGRTISNAITGGFIMASGYSAGGVDLSTVIELDDAMPLGFDVDGNSEELSIGVQVVGNTSESFLASILWKEYT
jgi:hypothetical protein